LLPTTEYNLSFGLADSDCHFVSWPCYFIYTGARRQDICLERSFTVFLSFY
jgi:hypothetical protein